MENNVKYVTDLLGTIRELLNSGMVLKDIEEKERVAFVEAIDRMSSALEVFGKEALSETEKLLVITLEYIIEDKFFPPEAPEKYRALFLDTLNLAGQFCQAA